MPIDPSPSTIATGQLQQIPFGNLIGAPLDAAIKAQANAALTTVDFIKSVGLQTTKDGVTEAVYVVFSYQDSNGSTRNLIMPLLAIVPIPYISIDTISIDFKANISAESSTSTQDVSSTTTAASASVSANYWFVKADFNASYSSKKDSTATANSKYSVEYTMDVSVRASQAGMPAGLATVLQILNKAVTTCNPRGELIVITPGDVSFNAANQELEIKLRARTGDFKPMKGASVAITLDPASVLTADPATVTTDADGNGSFKLKAPATLPATPTDVNVALACTPVGSTDVIKESFTAHVQ